MQGLLCVKNQLLQKINCFIFRKKGFLQDVRHNLQKAFFKAVLVQHYLLYEYQKKIMNLLTLLGDSSLERDKEKYQYSYEDIIEMLQANVKLTDVHK